MTAADRRRHQPVRAGALAALALVGLVGCQVPGAAHPSGTPASTAPATPGTSHAPDPTQVRLDGTALTSGTLTLHALPATGWTALASALDDGSARLDLTPDESAADTAADSAADSAAVLAAPVGTVWDVLADGSAVLRDPTGTLVGGVVPTGARIVREGDEVVGLVPRSGPASLWLATVAVEAADWGQREGGRSLAVTPSAWARAGGLAAEAAVREQLVAREPEAGSPTMLAQLACHELGAPDKATWNLEPWRPDVGPLDMIAARCNP